MGINANYVSKDVEIKDAYIRIERIWGSSREGWNAWVGVYQNQNDVTPVVPLIHIQAAYVEGESPFTILYTAIEKYPNIKMNDVLIGTIDPIVGSEKSIDEVELVDTTKIKPKSTKRRPKTS